MALINHQDTAFRHVMDWAKKKYGCWFQRMDYHKGRHVHLRPMRMDAPSFYVVYKREFFMTFEHVFPEFIEENSAMKGEGESLNEEALLRAVRLKATYIAFVHPDGSVWVIHPMIFLNFASKYGLKRTQVATNFYKLADGTFELQETHETTLSIPKALLVKMEDV